MFSGKNANHVCICELLMTTFSNAEIEIIRKKYGKCIFKTNISSKYVERVPRKSFLNKVGEPPQMRFS